MTLVQTNSDILERSANQFYIATNYNKYSIVVKKNKSIRKIKGVYAICDNSYLYVIYENDKLSLYFMTPDSLYKLKPEIVMTRRSVITYYIRELHLYCDVDIITKGITFLSFSQSKNIADESFVDLFNSLKKDIKIEIIGRFKVQKNVPLRPQLAPVNMVNQW